MLYPLKFKKVFMEKVWGGRKFEEFLNMDLPKKINIGESWEVSAHPNGMSIVENGILKGRSLQDIYNEYIYANLYKIYINIRWYEISLKMLIIETIVNLYC